MDDATRARAVAKRKSLGLWQSELAKQIGVWPSTLERWEANHGGPSRKGGKRWLKALGLWDTPPSSLVQMGGQPLAPGCRLSPVSVPEVEWMFFDKKMTMTEIGDRLGCSPETASKYVGVILEERARETIEVRLRARQDLVDSGMFH